jgi:HD-like signal output (HDOD) protein
MGWSRDRDKPARVDEPLESAPWDKGGDAIVDQARAVFLQVIRRGEFRPPLMPTTVREAMDLTRNPNSSFLGLSTVIEKDPPLTANLLKLANSPLYGARDRIGGLRMALTRIGLRGLNEVLMIAAAAEVLVVPGDPGMTQRLQERAVGVALAANGIAHRCKLDDDAAFTAGVLHDVGWAIGFGLMRRARRLLPDALKSDLPLQREVIEQVHGELGLELAMAWGLPEATAQAIGFHHNPSKAPSSPKLAYCIEAARKIVDRADWHPEDPDSADLGCGAFDVLGLMELDARVIVADVRRRLGLSRS